MLKKPSKQKTRQFAIWLQANRNKISKKYKKLYITIYKYILQKLISKIRHERNIDIKKYIKTYKKEIQIAIKNIYRNAYKVYGRTLRDTIKKDDTDKKYSLLYLERKFEIEQDLFEITMDELYEEYSETHSDYILETMEGYFLFYEKQSQKKYYEELNEKHSRFQELESQIIQYSILGLSIDKIKKTMQKLQTEITSMQNNKFDNILENIKKEIQENVIKQHSEKIATQETLFAESLTRQKEAEFVQKEIEELKTYKEWNSMFLETSRPSHMEVSGQVKEVHEDFIVNNPRNGRPEYGKEPKDERFSIENKINCYCFLTYFLE